MGGNGGISIGGNGSATAATREGAVAEAAGPVVIQMAAKTVKPEKRHRHFSYKR